MTTPPRKPSHAQVAAQALLRAEEAVALNAETHQMVKELHDALMKPQPGYSASFLTRATEVVLEAEAGKIVGAKLVWYAKVLTALGVIGSTLFAITQYGGPQK